MTVLSRRARARRSGRRPEWTWLTTLLALAVLASSALVFTSRVELLKLAVVLALWAAVAAAFVSVVYRRQSDADQARARELKHVYDLQLDREIAARREYELTVEAQLRRELTAELRTQAADEVAALRAELAALRTNLEIWFDADLGHRPELETERTTVRAYSDWAYDSAAGPDTEAPHAAAVLDPEAAGRTAENPIIDVPEVGVPAGSPAAPSRQQTAEAAGTEYDRPGARRRTEQISDPQHQPAAEPPSDNGSAVGWQPAPAAGAWLPPGAPGSNWASTSDADSRAADQPPIDRSVAFSEPPGGGRHGRHAEPAGPAVDSFSFGAPPDGGPPAGRRARSRHSAEPAPEEYSEAAPTTAPLPTISSFTAEPAPAARHRGPDSETPAPTAGAQTVAELLARLQTENVGRRRRRRADDD